MWLKLLILVLFFNILSCSNKKQKTVNNLDTVALKAICQYNIADDKKEKLSVRLQAINSAYKLSEDGKLDTLSCKILYKKIILHYSNKQYDSMLYYNKKLLNQSKKQNNIYYQGKVNYLYGFYFDDIKYYPDSAFYFYNQSKNNFLILQDSSEIGKCLLNMGYLQKNSSDFYGSKETITSALQYLKIKNDRKYVTSAYNVLAINNKELLNHEDAIKYYKKAIEIAKSEISKSIYKNNMSVTYTNNNEYDIAIKLLQTLIKDSLILSSPLKKARVIDNLAYAKWLKDTIDVSIKLYKSLEIREKYNDKISLIASYLHLGEFLKAKNIHKSISFFKKAIEISRAIKNPKNELQALRFLMEIKPNDVKLKSRYIILSDSLKRQELTVKTQFAKIQYDDKLKNEQIDKLNNLTNTQKLEVLAQKRQKTIYLLTGVILVLVVLFYLHYLIKKHKNDKAESVIKAQQSLSKKVHDEIANDISVLTNYVEENSNLPMSSSENLLEQKLNNIYLRARDISTDNRSIDFSNFKEELSNLILQYNSNHVKVITNLSEFNWHLIQNYKKYEIYRVIQELLINTKKHSKCKRISLIFNEENKNRIITYTDDGVGSNMIHIKKNGLNNAENRIKKINGVFTFDTSPEKGFRAKIIFKK